MTVMTGHSGGGQFCWCFAGLSRGSQQPWERGRVFQWRSARQMSSSSFPAATSEPRTAAKGKVCDSVDSVREIEDAVIARGSGRNSQRRGRKAPIGLELGAGESWQSGAASREGDNLRRDSTERMSETSLTLFRLDCGSRRGWSVQWA